MDKPINNMDLDAQIQVEDAMVRYGAGESLDELAKELGHPPESLRALMKKYDFDRYKKTVGEAAQSRMDLRHVGRKHLLSRNLTKLIKDIDDEDISIADRCKIEKVYGDRVAITEGEATERQEHVGKVTTIVTFKDLPDDNPEQTIP